MCLVYMNMEKDTPKDEVKATKQYIAWLFDQHEKEDPETMCVVLLDMSGAGGSLVSASFQFNFFENC